MHILLKFCLNLLKWFKSLELPSFSMIRCHYIKEAICMTYSQLLEQAKQKQLAEIQPLVWDDDLVYMDGPGHVWAVANSEKVHNVIHTASALANMLAIGCVEEERAVRILRRIEKCQCFGCEDPRCEGNFSWYSEENGKTQDLNAAFFILMPFLKLRLVSPESLTPDELTVIDRMMVNSLPWFKYYCANAEFYYSNPAISNSACLYGISILSKNQDNINAARDFLLKFFDYNASRGWGWGESISPCYTMEIVPPLKVISLLASQQGDEELRSQADALIEEIGIWFRFHGDMEVVPAIRNYNVQGKPSNTCGLKGILGVTNNPASFSLGLFDLLLFRSEMENYEENHQKCLEVQKDSVFVKRVFDDKFATTWKGENIHLGTISEYPVMPGCLQNPTWGNGWQAMPVAFVVRDEQLSYQRWQVTTGDRRRCFPHEVRYCPNDINSALFNERWYPDMYTLCSQNENIAIVHRRMNSLHNSAKSITDEFAIASFKGNVAQHHVHGIDWAVLTWPGKATVLLGALHGLTVHHKDEVSPRTPDEKLTSTMGIFDDIGEYRREPYRRAQKLVFGEHTATLNNISTTYLTIGQTYYEGPEQRLDFRALETSWAIIALDQELENPLEYLENQVQVDMKSIADMRVYRLMDAMINSITLTVERKTVSFCHDPYERKNWR